MKQVLNINLKFLKLLSFLKTFIKTFQGYPWIQTSKIKDFLIVWIPRHSFFGHIFLT